MSSKGLFRQKRKYRWVIMNKLFWLGAGMLVLSACSALTGPKTQDITVVTNPPGANCTLAREGIMIGRIDSTPAKIQVRRSGRDISVSCGLNGYQDQTYVNHAGLTELVWTGSGSGWGSVPPSDQAANYESVVTLTLTPVPSELKAGRLPGASFGDLANEGDANIILRFQALERLFNDELITRDEYNKRRGANLGALLRYTASAPAAGLGRTSPKPDEVVDRLRYLAVAFEEKSITAREQSAERAVILDALLPAVPAVRADPPPPVTDPIQAAAVVGRLERLLLAKVINANEQAREKDAVFRSLQVAQANAEAAASAAVGMTMAPVGPPSGPGVWLGSYASENQARLAWASLQLTHASELGTLQSEIKKVSLRHRRASYHLNAGSVASRKAAEALCKVLRGQHQFCRPTVMGR
jgi:hypothetical protein